MRDLEFNESWEENSYSTGATNPPAGRHKWLVPLVVAVILLGGVAGVLGVMNVQLFRQVSRYEKEAARHPNFHMNNRPSTEGAGPRDEGLHSQLTLETAPKAVENAPEADGKSLQQIYAENIDSVVSISTGSGSGTGVVLDKKGHIVTNCHVVQKAKKIQVRLNDNRVLAAKLVGVDTASDLAVLYVEADDLKPARFGDSSTLQVGDAVVAIGDPLGLALRGTMTDGIISAINRDITNQGRTMTLIQTNAALNAGNSGGPLINCYGQVIGINTMKVGDFVNKAGVEGLGFAIPSATVKEVADQLISQGYVTGRPALGLFGESVSTFLQHYYRLPPGVYVTQVVYGGAAHKAGLEPGDIILTFDDKKVTTQEELAAALYTTKAGDRVELVVQRGEVQMRIKLTVGQSAG